MTEIMGWIQKNEGRWTDKRTESWLDRRRISVSFLYGHLTLVMMDTKAIKMHIFSAFL